MACVACVAAWRRASSIEKTTSSKRQYSLQHTAFSALWVRVRVRVGVRGRVRVGVGVGVRVGVRARVRVRVRVRTTW